MHDSSASPIAGTEPNPDGQRGNADGSVPLPAGQEQAARSGTNSAGLAIFRYQTNCGTVYGNTGKTPGYTQFIAATRAGSRSAIVAAGEQITPKSDPKMFAKLRAIYGVAANG